METEKMNSVRDSGRNVLQNSRNCINSKASTKQEIITPNYWYTFGRS